MIAAVAAQPSHQRTDTPAVSAATDPLRACLHCRCWSQWLGETGDCLFHALRRRDAILARSGDVPAAKAARVTSADETCEGWEALRS